METVQPADLADLDYPPPSAPRGSSNHPLYREWKKMIDGCADPKSKHWSALGAKGAFVMRRWFDFHAFVEDMYPAWDDDESKPMRFRRIYLGRKNLKVGFNPTNAVWVTRAEAKSVQAKTILVKTPFNNGQLMTLRQLAQYLEAHQGEDLPEGYGPYTLRVREWSDEADALVTTEIEVTTISAVNFHELRRRHQRGQDLLRPTRPYGETDEIIAQHHLSQLEADRQRRQKAAEALGMTLAEYDAKHYADGSRKEFMFSNS
jgi:hypothetical protein